MLARITLIGIGCLSLSLVANDFREIEELIHDGKYSNALDEMGSTKLSRITTKRLLVQLAQQWPALSSAEKTMFNSLVSDLLPADRVFVKNIKERYQELVDEEMEHRAPPQKMAPTPVPRPKPRPKEISRTPTPMKKAAPVEKQVEKAAPKKIARPPQKKTIKSKKVASKRKAPPQVKPVSPESRVQVIERYVPVQRSVREEI